MATTTVCFNSNIISVTSAEFEAQLENLLTKFPNTNKLLIRLLCLLQEPQNNLTSYNVSFMKYFFGSASLSKNFGWRIFVARIDVRSSKTNGLFQCDLRDMNLSSQGFISKICSLHFLTPWTHQRFHGCRGTWSPSQGRRPIFLGPSTIFQSKQTLLKRIIHWRPLLPADTLWFELPVRDIQSSSSWFLNNGAVPQQLASRKNNEISKEF